MPPGTPTAVYTHVLGLESRVSAPPAASRCAQGGHSGGSAPGVLATLAIQTRHSLRTEAVRERSCSFPPSLLPPLPNTDYHRLALTAVPFSQLWGGALRAGEAPLGAGEGPSELHEADVSLTSSDSMRAPGRLS